MYFDVSDLFGSKEGMHGKCNEDRRCSPPENSKSLLEIWEK